MSVVQDLKSDGKVGARGLRVIVSWQAYKQSTVPSIPESQESTKTLKTRI